MGSKKPNDKTLYELPSELKNELAGYPKPKTTWYAYFLLIAILTSAIAYSFFLFMEKYVWHKVIKIVLILLNNSFIKGYPYTYILLRNDTSFHITLRVLFAYFSSSWPVFARLFISRCIKSFEIISNASLKQAFLYLSTF